MLVMQGFPLIHLFSALFSSFAASHTLLWQAGHKQTNAFLSKCEDSINISHDQGVSYSKRNPVREMENKHASIFAASAMTAKNNNEGLPKARLVIFSN